MLNVAVPRAEARSRFTMLMESLIIEALKGCRTVTGACYWMRIDWDQASEVVQLAA